MEEALYISGATSSPAQPDTKKGGEGTIFSIELLVLRLQSGLKGGSILHFFCDRPPGQMEIKTLEQQLLKSKISQA